ncbi:MAG: ATP-binding protein [Candidatus Anstonellales archaeon]
MENLVFVELLRRNLEVSYYQNIKKEEVDFVIRKGKKLMQLIQVCYSIGDFITKEREIKPLFSASKEFKCNNLLVITKEYEAEEKIKGKKIKFMPLWKWLLGKV